MADAPDIETLRKRAVAYYAKCNMPERLQKFLNQLYLEQPNDIYGRLAEYFGTFEKIPVVTSLQCETVLDSECNPAVKCAAAGIVRNHDVVLESAQMSIHKEVIGAERAEPTDEEASVTDQILSHVEGNLTGALTAAVKGISLIDQSALDAALMSWADGKEAEHAAALAEAAIPDEDAPVEDTPPPPSPGGKKKKSAKGKGKAPAKPIPPKESLPFQIEGCTALSAASIALVKSGAKYLNKEVYEHLQECVSNEEGEKVAVKMPIPAIILVSGGKTGPGKLNAIKGVFAIAKPGTSCADAVKNLTSVYKALGTALAGKTAGCPVSSSGAYIPVSDKLEQALDACIEAITQSGLVPGEDVMLGVDCAAHEIFDYEKGKYEVVVGTLKAADDMVEFYRDVVTRYPSVVVLVDPLRKEDREQWLPLCEATTEKCLVVGSEVFYGSSHKIDSEVLTTTQSNGVLVCCGGRTTCSDLATLQRLVADSGGVTVMTSAPCDVIEEALADVVVGIGCDIVVFGAPSRGENTARINRLLAIEKKLKSSDANVTYAEQLPFTHIKVPTPPPSVEPEEAAPSPTVKSAKKK